MQICHEGGGGEEEEEEEGKTHFYYLDDSWKWSSISPSWTFDQIQVQSNS